MNKYALFGLPVDLSLSPRIHQAFAEQFNMKISYEKYNIKADDFKHSVQMFFKNNGHGLNITVPYKNEAFNLADCVTKNVQQAKAANTLWMENGKLMADNTDGKGFISDLKNKNISVQEKTILLLGAGGAVSGILGPLLDCNPAKVIIANRTETRATELIEHFSNPASLTSCAINKIPKIDYDIIINGLSTHSFPDEILQHLSFKKTQACYDLKYGSAATSFIKFSKEKNIKTIADGWGMLVKQAALSFQIWTGKTPKIDDILDWF